jgi:hypothetical protein
MENITPGQYFNCKIVFSDNIMYLLAIAGYIYTY